jgi:predicted NodU family carbamoyl transferase
MMQVFQICEEKRRLIPAVTHVDGSGRLQTVYRETNPRRLIETFAEITGVPMVLNTSFNENEPVVGCPEEALFSLCPIHLVKDQVVADVMSQYSPPLAHCIGQLFWIALTPTPHL